MCVLCSQLWIEEHWADVAAEPSTGTGDVIALETHATQRGQRLRNRAARSRLFNLVLGTCGLTLQDWEGSSYILRDAKGATAVVFSLAGVWEEAERMTGKPIDPLDPGFLESLRARMSAEFPEP
jgi:hypothetical protein